MTGVGAIGRIVAINGRLRPAELVDRRDPAAGLTSDHGVERLSERHIPRIASERRSHLARHVRIANAHRRIGETKRASGPGSSKRIRTTEGPRRTRFHEAQRESHRTFQALVVEPARGWNRGRGQEIQRLRSQP